MSKRPTSSHGSRESLESTVRPFGAALSLRSAPERPSESAVPLLMSPKAAALPRRSPSLGSTNLEKNGAADFRDDLTVSDVAEQLQSFRNEVRQDHSQFVAYIIESAKVTERRVHHGTDLFASLKSTPVPGKTATSVRFKFKHFLKGKKADGKEEYHTVTSVKTDKDRVPRYRFHHVPIKKNVLTPNTMLTFVPHLRDLESSEEMKYNLWLKELEDIDLKSGFKPVGREEKQLRTYQLERAVTLAPYLDTWLEKLAIPGCDRQALVRYMASLGPAAATQQKPASRRESSGASAEQHAAARMFADAFAKVFKKKVNLRKVLLLEESADGCIDSKPQTKDGAEDEDEFVETHLASYCLLGCLVCFSHSCDHGEYDNKNLKRTFSMVSCVPLSESLKRRRRGAIGCPFSVPLPCTRRCYRYFEPRSLDWSSSEDEEEAPWSEEEQAVLRSLFATCSHSAFKGDPICLAAKFLSRSCRESHAKLQSLSIRLPEATPLPTSEPTPVKNLPWYDRRKKALLGDWQEHTLSHQHQRRETLEPCYHEGPCVSGLCPCVDAGLLCDKFCGCTADDCAYKFTGCACHSQGKTCQQKQKDRPCICVQLNRECDPQLCGSCGVIERADPLNSDDEQLHATGCQNCSLQRGVGKPLILGQSQLEGVGYGLYTAQDIGQDDFIIEYVGELISHDEGVRREARRGDVFDEESNLSYVFTLLENEGIWVDAAIYGNLSRYINHASEHDKRGCNITPRILYVNGEYRIKFTAMRDIQAGEELFFNYGENFPNLTKKLLDHKAGQQAGRSRGSRARRAAAGDQVARKAPKLEPKQKRSYTRRTKKVAATAVPDRDPYIFPEEEEPPPPPCRPRGRKPRGVKDLLDGKYDGFQAVNPTKAEEEDVGGGARRLRKRTRACSGSDFKMAPEPPKKKSKRGGARPGSGRPRKHPRPAPKPTLPGALKVGEVEGVVEGDIAVVSSGVASPGSGRPKKQSQPAPKPTLPGELKAGEIESEVEDDNAEERSGGRSTAKESEATAETVGSDAAKSVEMTRSNVTEAEVVVIEDTDDETDSDVPDVLPAGAWRQDSVEQQDDEDQDVMVRKRHGREPRSRRLPAKLRDDSR
ncbi:SET domain protein [Ophiocordyceps camponoti-floridani]|uniref:SET domain protein n=1 Tax=Ophiocordyceps camponoti-floridani TaxID=2030778 RepID=A0A8H4Q882_9HYPO|nr:SET domain protein [Ophiocordyceps camponoti-floridani]